MSKKSERVFYAFMKVNNTNVLIHVHGSDSMLEAQAMIRDYYRSINYPLNQIQWLAIFSRDGLQFMDNNKPYQMNIYALSRGKLTEVKPEIKKEVKRTDIN
jgi:hypothetical protein